MLKHIKYLYCILFFSFMLMSNVFSYSLSKISSYTSSTSSGYSSMSGQVVFEQYLTLGNVNVNFTQDDTYYYFEITANASINLSNIISSDMTAMNYVPCPLFYKIENFGNQMIVNESCKEPYADVRSGNFYSSSLVNIKGNAVSNYMNKYHFTSGSHVTDEFYSTGNGDRYFMPNELRNNKCRNNILYRYTSTYPDRCVNNGEGVTLISNGSSSYPVYGTSNITDYVANYNVKIGINKSYMDSYRYLCFAESFVILESSYLTSRSENYAGLSICSNTIDLKEYANCEHKWMYEVTDKLEHKAYCENCKWEKNEPHSLLYEYDGIHFDVCTCSYIDKVKYRFEINDDNTLVESETCDTYEDYEKHPYTHKTGYNFKWYEKYEKDFISNDNLSTISNATITHFVSTVSQFDDIAGNKSVIYKAKYSPIKYTFNYENENNYNLTLNKKISSQVINYDEKAHLKENIDVRGYVFKGWTLEKGSSKIYLNKLQDVTNYTAEDLKEITIYPIYERMDYTIVYNSGDYSFKDGTKEKVVHYNFFDTGSLEQINLNSSDRIVNGYADDNGKMYTNLSQVQKEIERIGKVGTTIYLRVSVSSRGIGSPERPSPGMGNVVEPTAPKSSILIETNTVNTEILETTNSLEEPKYLYDYESIPSYIITGMSDTKKEIVPEEKNNKEKNEEEGTNSEEIVATLSVANKWHRSDKTHINKLRILQMFIKANKIRFIFMVSLLFILLVIYEAFILRQYAKDSHYNNLEMA
ncbi:MAG: hypothetical protein J6M39_02795 [Lachnospiraceae bacterium]|nr:hypothetical protein [Lachnospiraceae bacterium]